MWMPTRNGKTLRSPWPPTKEGETMKKLFISQPMRGKTDEENLGFTYNELDKYIRTGEIEDQAKKENIDRRHKANLFKLQLMPVFDPKI